MSAGEFAGVTVVMPVVNEAKHLATAVAQILAQQVELPLQLILAVGPSTDQTLPIAQDLALNHNQVEVVANPTGKTPAGLNLAIALAKYDLIVRVDGHSLLPPKYIQTAVELISQTNSDVVGGVMAATGTTQFEIAVASAMRSSLGVGPARFHTGGGAGPVPTVYLGVFRKSAIDRVGGFDESFIRAQDWEMNYRIRKTGGQIWFDPRLEVTYRPRATFKALAKQYFDYGKWRHEVARTYPETKSLRYLAPPATVLALLISLLLLIGLSALQINWNLLFVLPIIGYLSLIAIGSLFIFNKRQPLSLLYQPFVLLTMHMCWGVGFLISPKNLRAPK